MKYYILIIVPLILIAGLFLYKLEIVGLILLALYIIVYRPIIDWNKLNKQGIVERKDFWIFFMPFSRFKFFKELYMKK